METMAFQFIGKLVQVTECNNVSIQLNETYLWVGNEWRWLSIQMRAFMDEMSQFGEQLKQDISLWPFPVRIIHETETAFNRLGLFWRQKYFCWAEHPCSLSGIRRRLLWVIVLHKQNLQPASPPSSLPSGLSRFSQRFAEIFHACQNGCHLTRLFGGSLGTISVKWVSV